MSEVNEKNIFQRILAVMEDIDYIQKCDKKVNNQYSFVKHDDVTEKMHPLFVKHGIVVVPSVESYAQEGNRTTVLLAVSFVNASNPENHFTIKSLGYGVDPGDKGPGKAISYAYKYALLKTFALATGDDPDNDAKATYEPVKCLEFDLQLPADLKEKERKKLDKFLEFSAKCMNIHVEDVKREALGRMPEFINACRNWNQ